MPDGALDRKAFSPRAAKPFPNPKAPNKKHALISIHNSLGPDCTNALNPTLNPFFTRDTRLLPLLHAGLGSPQGTAALNPEPSKPQRP